MMSKSTMYGINYQFAIPAASTAHEFESRNGIPSNVTQEEYVEAALTAIAENNVTQDPHYKGISICAFTHSILFKSDYANPVVMTPTEPNNDTLAILQRGI